MANIAALLLLEQDMNAEIDDTDTTNDDIHTTIIACIAAALYRVDKTRVSGYVETVVPYYSNESFRRKFRVSRATFNVMHNYVKRLPELQCEGDGGRENISTEKQLLLTLWYMGCSDNIDKIADRFGVSESSVIRCRNRVVKAILKHLKCRFIFWPKIADMQIVVDSFAERNGFPGIVGALDGTHIEIKTPGVNGASYINRKGYASLQLQAVCNHEMIFTDVFAGFPGSCHDARVLRNSDLWEDGLQLCNNVNNILADSSSRAPLGSD